MEEIIALVKIMNQINQVLLEGNVVKDAEISETAQGNYVSKFPIEVKRYYRNAKGETVTETCYFDVKAWGETFAQFCKRVKNAELF